MKIPYISSEWRTLLKPKRFGKYVNDHTLFWGGDKLWHLIGITSKKGNPSAERYFTHATGSLRGGEMTEIQKVIDTGTLAWAPCVIANGGDFYMFYGPSPTKLAASRDCCEWFGHPVNLLGAPPMACHRDHFVLQVGEQWVMYVSGVKDGKSCISYLTSEDLLTWNFGGYALTSGQGAPLNPEWGAMESPYIVKYEDIFYLFVTYTDCAKQNYEDTLVFASDSPLSFGEYGGENGVLPIAKIKTHAPEIVVDGDKYYITSCGWKRSSSHKGRVVIAELQWK